MQIAIDIIPSEKKKDFLHAMRCAPHLIQTESHPIKFLRCEEFNPWRAARRLVLYWYVTLGYIVVVGFFFFLIFCTCTLIHPITHR